MKAPMTGISGMAKDYINQSIVSAGRGESTTALGAYLFRGKWWDPIIGRTYDFSAHAGDLLMGEILVPDGMEGIFKTAEELAAAMMLAELVTEKKTKLRRFRKNAQLARHIILALPKELTARQRLDLARRWAKRYTDAGAAVLLAVHEADDPEIGNYHAHLLVSMRTVETSGFSRRKARHLNPVFTRGKGQDWATLHKDDLPGQWRAFQNAYFREHDIPLSVDPNFLIAGRHLGKARFLENSDLAAENAAAREEACRRIREIPELLTFATRNAATFTRKSLGLLLRQHEVPKEEAADIIDAALSDAEVVRLIDPVTGKAGARFTTRTVRSQEMQILELARSMADRLPGKKKLERLIAKAGEIARRLGLADEQLEALLHCMTGGDLTLIRGVAGAGKSYTVWGMREVLEASGYRVVGLAPTNKVAVTMAVDGFGHAATIDLELLRQESGRKGTVPWDKNTCIVIDEAGMVNSALLERVLRRAEAAGAKVILVGDQAQLASVSRGGMFGILKDQLGCAEIREIRRQEADWAKAASLDFAEGNIKAGLAAYADRGHLTFDDTLDDAMDALVRKWSEDFAKAPEVERFVYAATNKSVNRLNEALQAARWSGQRMEFTTFATERGEVELTVGDRIQTYGNCRKDDIFNGMVGTVTAIAPDRICFVADGGKELCFCPDDFQQFGLGYAGTVYRGQGQTLPQTYALYDSKSAWNRRTTYVAMTRHKQAVNLFVPRTLAPDLATLGRQMDRADDGDASLAWKAVDDPQEVSVAVAAPLKKPILTTTPTPDIGSQVLAMESEIAVDVPTAPQKSPLRKEKQDKVIAPGKLHHRTSTTSDIDLALLDDGIPPVRSGLGKTREIDREAPRSASNLLDAIPFRIVLDGRELHYDLKLASERSDLRMGLRTASMKEVVEAYARIRAVEPSRPDALEVLRSLRGQMTHDGKTRGFWPKLGAIWRELLHFTRLDPQNILQDPELESGKNEVDIRPMMQPLLDVREDVDEVLARKLTGFVPEALRAVDRALREATARAAATRNEELQLGLINRRAWLYRLCYGRGIDLHPQLTRDEGYLLSPEEYRDRILTLGTVAARATGTFESEESARGTVASLSRRKSGRGEEIFRPTDDQKQEHLTPANPPGVANAIDIAVEAAARRDRFLKAAYAMRIKGLMRHHEHTLKDLKLQTPGNLLQKAQQDDTGAATIAVISELRERLEDFRAAPDLAIQRARALDFLPAEVDEDVLRRMASRRKLPSPMDAAAHLLEEALNKDAAKAKKSAKAAAKEGSEHRIGSEADANREPRPAGAPPGLSHHTHVPRDSDLDR